MNAPSTGIVPVAEYTQGFVADPASHAAASSPVLSRKREGETSARRGSWFGTYLHDDPESDEEAERQRSPRRVPGARAAHRGAASTPSTSRPMSVDPVDNRASSAEMMRLATRNGTPMVSSHGAQSRASGRETESSARRGSYFGTYKRQSEMKDRMTILAAKFYGRPHVIAPATRRYSYLSPDDEYLTAMDNNLQARRVKDMERQEKLINKTLERYSKNVEQSALIEAKRAQKAQERLEQERDMKEMGMHWMTAKQLRDHKAAEERAADRLRRMENLEDLITRKQNTRQAHHAEMEAMQHMMEEERQYRADQAAKAKAAKAQQRAIDEANRRADKAYTAAMRAAERQVYEDATRWSLEEARARDNMEAHTRRLLNGQRDAMATRRFAPMTNKARRREERKTPMESPAPQALEYDIGDVVQSSKSGEHGAVRFIGSTYFAPGMWVGVEFDSPIGNHDGMVFGQRYFVCRAKHGMFLRPEKLVLVEKADEADFVTTGRRSAASRFSSLPASTPGEYGARFGITPSPTPTRFEATPSASPAMPPAPAPTPADATTRMDVPVNMVATVIPGQVHEVETADFYGHPVEEERPASASPFQAESPRGPSPTVPSPAAAPSPAAQSPPPAPTGPSPVASVQSFTLQEVEPETTAVEQQLPVEPPAPPMAPTLSQTPQSELSSDDYDDDTNPVAGWNLAAVADEAVAGFRRASASQAHFGAGISSDESDVEEDEDPSGDLHPLAAQRALSATPQDVLASGGGEESGAIKMYEMSEEAPEAQRWSNVVG